MGARVGMKIKNQNTDGSGSLSDAQRNSTLSDAQCPNDALCNLVELAKQGSHDAYTQIVNEYKGKLHSTIKNIVYNHSDVEDILQDTLTKGYKYIGNFNGKSSVYTWLHKIAVNTAINFIRKSKKYGFSYSLDDTDNSIQFTDTFIEAISLNGVDIDIVNKEMGKAISDAMDKLSAEHRIVVQMFDIDGYSHNEIAKHVGCNENTVRSRLFYAHKKLQGMLAEYRERV